jgi:hypothetical protein
MVRDARKMFLHKGSWHKFKGYAYSQISKMSVKRQNNKFLKKIMDFEEEKNISNQISFKDVEKEMERRLITLTLQESKLNE